MLHAMYTRASAAVVSGRTAGLRGGNASSQAWQRVG